jgi:hypothetical protein
MNMKTSDLACVVDLPRFRLRFLNYVPLRQHDQCSK